VIQPLLDYLRAATRGKQCHEALQGQDTRCGFGNSRERPRANRSRMQTSSLLSSSCSSKLFFPRWIWSH
jgi:hypothetical protein